MTKKILHCASLRDWDTPETKAVYWSGACYALIAATDLYGCKNCPTGFRTLRRARQAWIDKNQRIADNFARKAGLLR